MTTEAAKTFNERAAFWTAKGLSGATLYEALARDTQLPAVFNSDDVAAIQGISPLSVKKQRTRQAGPNFLRVSTRAVRYPRAELCRYLASKFVRVAA